jgi:hypothetical protein
MNHEEMFNGDSVTHQQLLTKLRYLQLLKKDCMPWCAVTESIVTARWSLCMLVYIDYCATCHRKTINQEAWCER